MLGKQMAQQQSKGDTLSEATLRRRTALRVTLVRGATTASSARSIPRASPRPNPWSRTQCGPLTELCVVR